MSRISAFVFGAALAIGVLTLLVEEGHAATMKLCNRQIEYSITPPDPDLAPELRSLSGAWGGSVTFSPGSEMCVGLIVESIRRDGTVDTKLVWFTGSDTGIGNQPSLGAASWTGKFEDGILRLVGAQNGNTYAYEFKPTAQDKVGGYFLQNTHRTPLSLRRL